ncbi:Flp family type IVb pilin [Lederbergia citri]|uniref:Flp family type IVb pilin n=1 Tax=Lederbergia citri TaxID=2833580 RepID=A0A942THT6_9BACI|nr:Flp family type IVb pilin [Lederbergia citri]MBS4197905.1 Flp family type IVb pilin [Lederbergia citri]
MMEKIKALIFGEEGQGMTEYGLVLGLIAVGVVAVLIIMRDQIIALFNRAVDAIRGAGTTGGTNGT